MAPSPRSRRGSRFPAGQQVSPVFFSICYTNRASQYNLSKNQLDAQCLLFCNMLITFITSLYMFRAVTCSSSGG
jgi:hypothetical protein